MHVWRLVLSGLRADKDMVCRCLGTFDFLPQAHTPYTLFIELAVPLWLSTARL